MKRVSVALFLGVLACDSGSSGPDRNADGFTKVPNVEGLEAKVPDEAKPNGVGGAPGFHSDDDSFGFVLDELSPDEANKTLEEVKAETELAFFKKWIETRETDDGYVIKYESVSVDVFEDTESPQWSFEVRRKIGDEHYRCWGGLSKPDKLDAAIEACESVKVTS